MTTPLSFMDVTAQLNELYEQKEYTQALVLIADERSRFSRPIYTQRLALWQIRLFSCLNDTAQALETLKSLLTTGSWLPEHVLQGQEDLQLLQNIPEYQHMVEICRQRHAAAQLQAAPKLVTLKPDTITGTTYPLMMALHGNYRNVNVSIAHWESVVSQGWLLALPQSSQVYGPDSYIWDDIDTATQELQDHYATLSQQYPVDPTRTIIAGFSIGAGIATWLAFNGTIPVKGFIAVAPALPDLEDILPLIEAASARGLRGYIVVGERDYPEESQAFADALNARGLPCQLEIHPNLGHDFPSQFEQSLQRALEFITHYR